MNDEIFTEEDKRFYQWLSLIEEPLSTRVSIKDGLIELHVGDVPQASELWRAVPILKLGEGTLKHVDIYVGDKLFIWTRHPITLADLPIDTPNETFTEEDQRFYQWLSLITEPQKIKLFITDGLIEVHCGDRPQAAKLWRKSPILNLGQGTLKHLDIWVARRRILSTLFPSRLDP